MIDYFLLVKWIHIISATIFFGTGIGSAFYMFVANREKNIANIYFVTRYVVIADWLFTTPSTIVQFVTGILLANMYGYDFSENWLIYSIILYILAVLCWLPVVWIQIKMNHIARISLDNKDEYLPKKYWKLDFYWITLGFIALILIILVFYLMVFKPEF